MDLVLNNPVIRIIVHDYCTYTSSVYYKNNIYETINLGGEVDLARQCIKSVISGKLHLLLENGTQVQDNGNLQDESQHGKRTIISEAYLPGMSSCQVSSF